MSRSLILIVMLISLTGCKNWSDLSVGQKLIINDPDILIGSADLAGKGVVEFSECIIELKEKAFDESKYRGFVECKP